MNIGDKVKLSGTRIEGVIEELYSDRNKVLFGTYSKIAFAKVRCKDGVLREYQLSELRRVM